MKLNKKPMTAIMMLIVLSSSVAAIPFACFADGEVFNTDGTPVMNGTKVTIVNQVTNETIDTTTGYPHYPPVKMYNNDYKSVFTCEAGHDKLMIKAENGTHYGIVETTVPADSQTFENITLDQKYPEKEAPKKTGLLLFIKNIVNYFVGKRT